MRCIHVKHPANLDSLSLGERPDPLAGPGEVLVRWRAASLNYHDYVVAMGLLPVAEGRIPLSDGAGEIIALGEGVEQWRIGDRVMSSFFPHWQRGPADAVSNREILGETRDGCATELSALPASEITAMPENLDFAEAACLPCAGLTAWRALMVENPVKPGDTVLVQGSGGMSVFALQFAKAAGAKVIATSSSTEKMQRLMALGADATVNYREDANWGRTVYELAGSGAQHVIDVGGNATLEHSLQAAAVGAKVSLIGILGGFTAELNLPLAFRKQLHLQGMAVGSVAMQGDMVRAIEVNGIKPVIDRHFALSDLAEAFRYQASGAHFGKIVIDIPG